MSTRPVPMVDHYMGRGVVDVGYEGDNWFIEFEGGARIYSTDPNYQAPDESIKGNALRFHTLSQSVEKLFFGPGDNPRSIVMNFSPTHIEISDPDYNGGERVNPNWPQELTNAGIEPSAPGVRDPEGPSEEWLDQTARGAQVPLDEEEGVEHGTARGPEASEVENADDAGLD